MIFFLWLKVKGYIWEVFNMVFFDNCFCFWCFILYFDLVFVDFDGILCNSCVVGCYSLLYFFDDVKLYYYVLFSFGFKKL